MIPVSDAFLAACSQSHVIGTRVDVYRDDILVYEDLKVADGNVVANDTAIHTTGDITVNLEETIPSDTNRLLYPGSIIKPYRGIVFPDGTQELVPLGVLNVTDTRYDDSGDGLTLKVSLEDNAYRVAKNKFTKMYTVPAGISVIDAIVWTLAAFAPWAEVDLPAIEGTTAKLTAERGDDPWEFCRKLAAVLGKDLYFNYLGVCTLKEVGTTASSSVYTFTDGADGNLMYMYKETTDEGAFSRVVAIGESTSSTTTYHGEAIDNDPLSPTYYYGPFGDVPYLMVSSYYTSNAQCTDAATRQLAKLKGLREQAQLLNIPNPALEIGDTVRVIRTKYGIDELYHITKMTTPLIAIRGQNITLGERRLL